MKAKEITMQIVKNLGFYETVRLQATYTLTGKDTVDDAFAQAKQELEQVFKKQYKSVYETGFENVVPDAAERIPLLVNSKEFKRCKKGIETGKVTLAGLQEYFILTEDVITELLKRNDDGKE
jgi:hypothetical protein